MSDFRIDFSNVEPAKYEPLPAGNYRAKVTDVEVREAKDSGNKYLNVTFTVQEGPFEGKKFFNNLNFGEKSLPYTLAFLLHTKRFEAPVNATLGEIAEAIVGADVHAKLAVDDDQNKVKKWIDDDSVSSGSTNTLVP